MIVLIWFVLSCLLKSSSTCSAGLVIQNVGFEKNISEEKPQGGEIIHSLGSASLRAPPQDRKIHIFNEL